MHRQVLPWKKERKIIIKVTLTQETMLKSRTINNIPKIFVEVTSTSKKLHKKLNLTANVISAKKLFLWCLIFDSPNIEKFIFCKFANLKICDMIDIAHIRCIFYWFCSGNIGCVQKKRRNISFSQILYSLIAKLIKWSKVLHFLKLFIPRWIAW